MRTVAIAAAAALLCVAGAPCAARAQSTTTTTTATPAAGASIDEARRQFDVGVVALREERFADALVAFQASYAIHHAASVELNLGITLRGLGRLVEARQYLQRFLRSASPAQHTEHDPLVQSYLVELNRRIGVLHAAELSPRDAAITIDGTPVVLDTESSAPIDPGDHQVAAQASGYAPARQALHVDPGATVTVRFALTPAAPTPVVTRDTTPHPARATHERPPPSPSVFASPWFWTVAAVVVVAAVAVPVGIAATSAPPDPAHTSTGVVIEAVRP